MSSSNSIKSALNSLLPSYNPPNTLLSAAESLLALSRQRARNLKPDEEIARTHACAEIACTRLRAQLRLPMIKSGAGAPCPPRVYAKLVRFLEGVLGDANVVGPSTSTPRGKKRDGDGNVVGTVSERKREAKRSGNGSVQGTPTKSASKSTSAGFVGVVKSARKAKGKDASSRDDEKAPGFAMPSIRALCRSLATPVLAPHVYTGTCIVLGLAKLWSADEDIEAGMMDELKSDILSLITALYLMVLTRMQTREMTTEVYDTVTGKAVDVLELGADALERIEEWIGRLNEEGWCDGLDWWGSVPEAVLEFDPEGAEAGEGNGNGEGEGVGVDGRRAGVRRIDVGEDDPDRMLLPGLGTMLHEGIDWTSAERCLDYSEWLDGMSEILNAPGKAVGKARTVAVK